MWKEHGSFSAMLMPGALIIRGQWIASRDLLHGNISLSDSNKEVGIVGRCLTYPNGVRSSVVPRGKTGVTGNL